MVDLVRVVLLAAHLITGAVACAAPAAAAIAALWPHACERWPSVTSRLVALGIAGMVVSAVIGGVSGAAILAAEDQRYMGVVARVPGKDLGMLVAEWLFTTALYGLMAWLARDGVRRPVLFAFVGLVAVTNVAYHFPTIMTVVGAEAVAPTLAGDELLDRPAYRQRIVAPVMIARTLHFWALTVTVGGIAVAATTREEREDSAGRPLAIAAAWGVIAGLSLQALTGAAALILLPAASLRALTGDDLMATTGLATAIAALLATGYTLLPAALGASNRLQTTRVATILAIAVLMMTWSTHRSRDAVSARETPGRNTVPTGRLVVDDNRRADRRRVTGQDLSPLPSFSVGSFLTSSNGPPGSLPSAISSS